MPSVSWNLTVLVSGGASVATSANSSPVEAVDRVEVSVEAGAENRVIELQPSDTAQMALLHIRTTAASAYSSNLTFIVSDGTHETKPIQLTEPQLYTKGAMPLFGHAPKLLKVSNKTSEAVTLEVFVARDATP